MKNSETDRTQSSVYPGVGRQPQRDGGQRGGTLDGEVGQSAVSQQQLLGLETSKRHRFNQSIQTDGACVFFKKQAGNKRGSIAPSSLSEKEHVCVCTMQICGNPSQRRLIKPEPCLLHTRREPPRRGR